MYLDTLLNACSFLLAFCRAFGYDNQSLPYLTLPYIILPLIYTPKSLKHFIKFRTASKGIIIVSMISNIKTRASAILWDKVFKMDQVKFAEDSL